MDDFIESVIMDNFLVAVVLIIIGLGILVAVSKALCIHVRKPLVEFCNARGFSASPWLTLIIIGVGIYLLSQHYERMELEELMGGSFGNYSYMNTADRQINEYGGIVLIVLPLLVLLIRTRKYFIPVLFIKIICLPLDILYAVHGGARFVDARPLSKDAFHNEGQVYVGKNGKCYDVSGNPIEYNSGEEPSRNGYVEEKYQDQYRASQETGSYHTVSTESGDHYYSGDYVPFTSEGEVTEIRTYDSDYTSMD